MGAGSDCEVGVRLASGWRQVGVRLGSGWGQVGVRFGSGSGQVGVARRATGNGPRDVSLLRSGTSARVEGMPDSVRDGIPAGGPVSSDGDVIASR